MDFLGMCWLEETHVVLKALAGLQIVAAMKAAAVRVILRDDIISPCFRYCCSLALPMNEVL